MTHGPSLTLILLALLTSIDTVGAQPAPDPRVADLVQAGNVRVGLFPPQFSRDAATGELKGVWAETARALAARIGVKVILLEHPTPLKVVECLQVGECDAAFLGLAARFVDAADFSSPFIQFDYTLLVPAGSPIGSVTDADRPGVRITAVHDHASSLALSQMLRQAELMFGDAPDSAFELLRTGKAHALASTRPALIGIPLYYPVHACWRNPMGPTSTGSQFQRATRSVSHLSTSSSRTPRFQASCRAPWSALARAGSRSCRREIRTESAIRA